MAVYHAHTNNTIYATPSSPHTLLQHPTTSLQKPQGPPPPPPYPYPADVRRARTSDPYFNALQVPETSSPDLGPYLSPYLCPYLCLHTSTPSRYPTHLARGRAPVPPPFLTHHAPAPLSLPPLPPHPPGRPHLPPPASPGPRRRLPPRPRRPPLGGLLPPRLPQRGGRLARRVAGPRRTPI